MALTIADLLLLVLVSELRGFGYWGVEFFGDWGFWVERFVKCGCFVRRLVAWLLRLSSARRVIASIVSVLNLF